MSNKKNFKTSMVSEPVIELTTETEETAKVEDLRVDEYEVILARPDYFIINKNGNNELVNKKNNYKKGDMVIL